MFFFVAVSSSEVSNQGSFLILDEDGARSSFGFFVFQIVDGNAIGFCALAELGSEVVLVENVSIT